MILRQNDRYVSIPITYEFEYCGQRYSKAIGNIYAPTIEEIMEVVKQNEKLVTI